MIALWPCLMLCSYNPKTRPCLWAQLQFLLQEVSGELPIFVSGGSLGGGLSVCLCLQRPTFFRGWRQSSFQECWCHDSVYTPHIIIHIHTHIIYIYIYPPYNGTICITLKVYRILSNFRGLSSAWSFSLLWWLFWSEEQVRFSGEQLAEWPHNHFSQDMSEPEIVSTKAPRK